MNIGIVYYGAYPFNRGIDQLAQSLKGIGHEPIVVARLPEDRKRSKSVNSVPVVQIPFEKESLFRDMKYYHFPINPFWKDILINLGKVFQWQSIIVRESPLSWAVISAAKKLGVPAYIDMRENLSAMYEMGRAKNVLVRFFRSKRMVRLYERMTLAKFSHIFVVSEELKTWLAHTYPVSPEKISVMVNAPTEQFLQEVERSVERREKSGEAIRLVYAGWITENKGIGDIVESFPYVIDKNPRVRLRIIGDGPYLDKIKQRLNELSIQKAVEFFPMLTMPDLAKVLLDSHLGLETCWLNNLTHLTVPGKLFEYMACGLPVLSSARAPVVRILNETGAGRIYHSREPEKIAKVILDMVKDERILKKMGQRARYAIADKYNWQSNVEILRPVFGV